MTKDKRSDYDRLFYPFLYDDSRVDAQRVLDAVQQSTLKKCREIISLRKKTLEEAGERLIDTGLVLAEAFANGATLFAFGNGGSATDAQDIVADLVMPPYPNWQSLPAIALTNDISVVTAVGNDVGFDKVFARQIIALGRQGDIALGISTSGNSANILTGLEQAKKQGMLTVALAGYDGGKAANPKVVDCCLISSSDYIPRIQEAQATVYHALIEVIQAVLRGMPNTKNSPFEGG